MANDITVTLIAFKQAYMYGQWVTVRVYSPASQVRYTFADVIKVKSGRRRADSMRR
jgi:hypothetical protein